MEEKRLLGDPVLKPGRQPQSKRPRHWLLLPLVVLCCLLAIKYRSKSCSFPDKPKSIQYEGEYMRWESCGETDGLPLECSKIDVPMDQLTPHSRDDKTFSIPLIRIRGQNATQNILMNPGGPGASGLFFMYRLGKQLKTVVGDGFHLVSFDPRGVNSSTPRASCYLDASTRQSLSPVRSKDLEADSPEVFAWTQNFVKTCYDTVGEHLSYVNTPQTAADMNGILNALGQKDMYYWGFSYGTILGQTYATMFPERSKRIIIDAVADQFEWYGEGFEGQTSLVDTDAVLDGFFDRCIIEGSDTCALAKLAESTEELRKLVLSEMEKLQKQPISVYVNNANYGLLTFNDLWFNGVFVNLYKPQNWAALAKNLYHFIQGNATDAFLAYSEAAQQVNVDDTDCLVELNDGLITGPDYWPQDRQSILDHMLALYNISMFDSWQDKIFYQRQQWTLPKTHSFVPPKSVKTAEPLLILSTTYDPVCPLISAQSAKEVFEGSQIVEVKGYGHSTVAVPSTCVAQHIRRYLYEGILPDKYTQCEGDLPYFNRPDGSDKMATYRSFADSDERDIHLAQIELAQNWEFRQPR